VPYRGGEKMKAIPTQFSFANRYITPLVLTMIGLGLIGLNELYMHEWFSKIGGWLLIIGPVWFIVSWVMKKKYRP